MQGPDQALVPNRPINVKLEDPHSALSVKGRNTDCKGGVPAGAVVN